MSAIQRFQLTPAVAHAPLVAWSHNQPQARSLTYSPYSSPFSDCAPLTPSDSSIDPPLNPFATSIRPSTIQDVQGIEKYFRDQFDNDVKYASTSKIRRPPNCFFMYRTHRHRTRGSEKDQSFFSKKAGAVWNALPPAEKVLWIAGSRRLDAYHRSLWPRYRYMPGVSDHSKGKKSKKSKQSTRPGPSVPPSTFDDQYRGVGMKPYSAGASPVTKQQRSSTSSSGPYHPYSRHRQALRSPSPVPRISKSLSHRQPDVPNHTLYGAAVEQEQQASSYPPLMNQLASMAMATPQHIQYDLPMHPTYDRNGNFVFTLPAANTAPSLEVNHPTMAAVNPFGHSMYQPGVDSSNTHVPYAQMHQTSARQNDSLYPAFSPSELDMALVDPTQFLPSASTGTQSSHYATQWYSTTNPTMTNVDTPTYSPSATAHTPSCADPVSDIEQFGYSVVGEVDNVLSENNPSPISSSSLSPSSPTSTSPSSSSPSSPVPDLRLMPPVVAADFDAFNFGDNYERADDIKCRDSLSDDSSATMGPGDAALFEQYTNLQYLFGGE